MGFFFIVSKMVSSGFSCQQEVGPLLVQFPLVILLQVIFFVSLFLRSFYVLIFLNLTETCLHVFFSFFFFCFEFVVINL